MVTSKRRPSDLERVFRWLVTNNWKVVVYVLLILLCVLLAPQAQLRFIYTEF
jgi:hypothetical protein